MSCIEMANGKPHNHKATPIDVLYALADPNLKVELAEPDRWSPGFIDFMSKVMVVAPADRLDAAGVAEHPFIVGVDAVLPREGIADVIAKLDEHIAAKRAAAAATAAEQQ
mmetsp:Transcript_54796/g.134322  ORF Transcript_54796/g.134322 Transcript_54796/m.134322 type:complete len:110 (+) Transcript_54796:167-496(+)